MTVFPQVATRSLSFCWSIRLFWFIPFLCGVVSWLSRYVYIGWSILRESTTVCASKLHTTQVSHVWRNVQQLVQHNTGKFYHTVYWIQFLHIVGINLTLPPRRRLKIFYVGFIVPLSIIRFRFFEITDNSSQFAFPKAVRQKSGFHVQGIQLK